MRYHCVILSLSHTYTYTHAHSRSLTHTHTHSLYNNVTLHREKQIHRRHRGVKARLNVENGLYWHASIPMTDWECADITVGYRPPQPDFDFRYWAKSHHVEWNFISNGGWMVCIYTCLFVCMFHVMDRFFFYFYSFILYSFLLNI